MILENRPSRMDISHEIYDQSDWIFCCRQGLPCHTSRFCLILIKFSKFINKTLLYTIPCSKLFYDDHVSMTVMLHVLYNPAIPKSLFFTANVALKFCQLQWFCLHCQCLLVTSFLLICLQRPYWAQQCTMGSQWWCPESRSIWSALFYVGTSTWQLVSYTV